MTSPFDEARYRALLEGLEATETRLSELDRTKRIDSEYFKKSFLDASIRLKQIHTEALSSVAEISDGNHFSISDEFQEEGIPYYRGQDATGHFFIEQAQPVHISHKAFSLPHMKRSLLRKGDALLSIVGTIGELSLVSSESVTTCNCKLAILHPQSIKSGYLAVFLKSRYGQDQIHRLTRGAVQMGLLLEDMDQINIPRFPDELEEVIEKSVHGAKTALDNSVRYYRHAEQTLLRALGLENWQPPEVLTYERKSGDVFATGRLDAEHFQPRYDDLYRRIKKTGIETRRLREIIEPVMNGFDCRDFVEVGTPYIRVGDIKKGRIELESAFRIPLTADKIGKDISLQVGDVLFTRKGSFGNAAPVWDEATHAIISSEIMLLRLNSEYQNAVLPEYLALFLNSTAGTIQAEQWAHGAAFYSITQEDLGCFVIPLISKPEQAALRNLIMQSETTRKQAHNLLECAKRAVEIAIEENETTAMKFLKQSQEARKAVFI